MPRACVAGLISMSAITGVAAWWLAVAVTAALIRHTPLRNGTKLEPAIPQVIGVRLT